VKLNIVIIYYEGVDNLDKLNLRHPSQNDGQIIKADIKDAEIFEH
jgi:hypothetical protein